MATKAKASAAQPAATDTAPPPLAPPAAAAAKGTYVVLNNIKHNGRIYTPGQTIELSEEAYAALPGGVVRVAGKEEAGQ